jgi:membrane protein implicated in regulation of membrane protease activity
VVRSGTAGIATLIAASAAVIATLAMLVSRHWVAAGVLALLAFALYLLFVPLMRRADPELLKKRSRDSDRQLAALGRAMGRASGGWDPPRRDADDGQERHR